MKKRIFSLLLSLIFVMSVIPSFTFAATSNSCGNNATWEITENGELIISGTGATDSYAASNKVPWIGYKDKITKVTVKEGITGIGSKNFIGLSKLETVKLPDSLTSIGIYVFYECTELESIIIPSKVTSIGEFSFNGCTNLNEIYFKGTYNDWYSMSIGTSNDELANATLHYALTAYPQSCGTSANWLLYNNGELAIYGTGSIDDYTSSSHQPWANKRADITALIIEDGITAIGAKNFYGSTGLSTITLPLSVKTIAANAFTSCSALSVIYYNGTPEQFAQIAIEDGNDPFVNACVVYVDSTRDYIAAGVCGTKAGWVLYEDNTLEINGSGNTLDYAATSKLPWSSYLSQINTVSITEGITNIGKKLFGKFSNLKYVYFPSTIKSVEDSAFLDCTSLGAVLYNGTAWEDISIKSNNTALSSAIVMPYDTSRKITSAGSCGTSVGWILYDENELTFQGEGVMNNYSASSALPWAAYRSVIVNAKIENGITSIGSKTLTAHSLLSTVHIPDTVTEICNNAFYTADALSDIYYEGSPALWESIAIGTYNTALDSATIHYGRPDLILDTTDLSLEKDSTYTFKVTTEPAEMTVSDLIWSSSNEDAATVDENGTVTALAGGSAVITAKSQANEKIYAECFVSVYVPTQGISVDPTELYLETGQSSVLVATVSPEDATNKNVFWTSSNEDVATVDESGMVTAVSEGTADITVSTDGEEYSAVCTVTVTDPQPVYIPVTNVTLDITDHLMQKGETITLTATVEPEDATNKNVFWASSSEEVATVDENGTVTAVAGGPAIITATTEDGEFVAECLISVYVPVTGVSFPLSELTLDIGSITAVAPTVYPEDATNKELLWSSSDENIVALIGYNNEIQAISAGTAVITVETVDGSYTAEYTVTVPKPEPVIIPVTGIVLEETTIPASKGDTFALVATIEPSDATNKKINWTSSNESVATVDENGMVTTHSAGQAIITATTEDGGFTAECTVDVLVPATEIKLHVNKLDLTEGNTSKLVATVSPEDTTDTEIHWTTSNADVATVDEEGIVTAVSEGTATITATIASNPELYAECVVSVVSPEPDPVPTTGIYLNYTDITLQKNETSELFATVEPEDASNKNVYWSSSDETVATVDENGIVTAISGGIAIITVTTEEGGFTAECLVSVYVPVEGITLNTDSVSLIEGDTATLIATVSPEDATEKNVLWSSSDEEIAAVDGEGNVIAVSEGTATITAETSDGSFVASCTVTVTAITPDPVPVTGVSINSKEITLYTGNTSALVATVSPEDADNKNVFWTSSDEEVATVDENGVVTAISAGTAIITVTTEDGSFTAECTVVVNTKPLQPAELTVSSVKSREGKTVDVTVSLSNNPGFSNLAIEIGYDSTALTLVGVSENTETGATFTAAEVLETQPFNMSWNSVKNNTFNGELVTLTFEISENAPSGDYPITIDYYKGVNGDYVDGDDANYDENFAPVSLKYTNGAISVSRHTPGDINDDGKINEKDATLLLRCLAGWNLTEVVEEAFDTNGDDAVDSNDTINLLRYLAGWNVKLY